MKGSKNEFVVIDAYVNDLNIIGTPEELSKAINCLKQEFEMKDLGRTKFFLRLQIEYLKNGIFMYEETYTTKVLKQFYMVKSHQLCTLMVVRSFDVDKDLSRPQESDEDYLNLNYHILVQLEH